MKPQLKNFLLVILAVVISGILSKQFGQLYEFLIGRESSGWFWGPSDAQSANGFLTGIMFIFPLVLSFGGKGKYYYIAGLAVLDLWIVWGYYNDMMRDTILLILGLLLGTLLNKLYLKIKKTA